MQHFYHLGFSTSYAGGRHGFTQNIYGQTFVEKMLQRCDQRWGLLDSWVFYDAALLVKEVLGAGKETIAPGAEVAKSAV